MKIVFLSVYSGIVNRGVETYVHKLANRLITLGHDVTVFQGGKDLPIGAKYSPVVVAVEQVKEFTQEALAQLDPETEVVVSTNGGWQSVLCKWWATKHGGKIVIPGQSGPGKDDKFNLWTFPDAFVALTEYQAEWAKKVNPAIKVVKIPNGVDTNVFKKAGKPLKLNLSHPIIMCAAALVPMKRLDLAIRAVAKLEKGSLLLVGKGEQEEELKKLGGQLLPGRFQIMSFSHPQMPQVYKGVELFTFPTSTWESFGIVMLEAMASGVPVVATDDPIRREIVGNAGLFVNPEDSDEYAKTLEKALDTKWANKPREQAEKFSWDKVAQLYDELFRSLK